MSSRPSNINTLPAGLQSIETFNPIFSFAFQFIPTSKQQSKPQNETRHAPNPDQSLYTCKSHKIFDAIKITQGSFRATDPEDTECPICQDSFVGMTTLTHTLCKRSFHISCLENWLQSQKVQFSCPIDRMHITPAKVDTIQVYEEAPSYSYRQLQMLIPIYAAQRDRANQDETIPRCELIQLPSMEDVLPVAEEGDVIRCAGTGRLVPRSVMKQIHRVSLIIQIRFGHHTHHEKFFGDLVFKPLANKAFSEWSTRLMYLVDKNFWDEGQSLLTEWLNICYRTSLANDFNLPTANEPELPSIQNPDMPVRLQSEVISTVTPRTDRSDPARMARNMRRFEEVETERTQTELMVAIERTTADLQRYLEDSARLRETLGSLEPLIRGLNELRTAGATLELRAASQQAHATMSYRRSVLQVRRMWSQSMATSLSQQIQHLQQTQESLRRGIIR